MMKVNNVINRSEKNTHETINILLTPFESIIVTLEKEDDDDNDDDGEIYLPPWLFSLGARMSSKLWVPISTCLSRS